MADGKERVSPNEELYDQFFSFKEMKLLNISKFIFAEDTTYLADSLTHLSDLKSEILSDLESHLDRERWGSLSDLEKYANFSNGSPERSDIEDSFRDVLPAIRESIRRQLYKALDRDFGLKFDLELGEELSPDELPIKLASEGKTPIFFGQKEIVYSIGPSMFLRQQTPSGFKGVIYDTRSLFSLYEEGGYSRSLIERYNGAFKENIVRPNQMDYKFLSWMQNSASFSPLMDFTEDYLIALIEVLGTRNPTAFLYADSAIYSLTVPKACIINDEASINDLIKNITWNIYNLKSGIVPGIAHKVRSRLGYDFMLDFGSYRKIANLLFPRVLVFNVASNDNTHRKRGRYVFFYDYVAVNGKIFPVFKEGAKLKRQMIECRSKLAMREWMRNNRPMIRRAYLEDPRLEFGL